ncbi:MAG: gamma-glutamyltransferase [Pseudomonadales bacterium]|nr:gamma-glutamyltransferase [Pseudomonadales bacterium]
MNLARKNPVLKQAIATATVTLCFSATFTAPVSAEIAPEIATTIQQKKIATGSEWMVVTANNYASTAAAEILALGGSAVDAAIAAQLVLGLVEPQSSGIGGGGFMLHWDKTQQLLISFDGRETAPKAVNEDHFQINGKNMGFFDAVVGGHAVGTPGLLHMLAKAHTQYGVLNWSQLFQPAIKLAHSGFIISPRLHKLLQHMLKTPNGIKDPAMATYFLTSTGQVKAIGTRLKNPAYAQTLSTIATHGIAVFYSGPIANHIVAAVQMNAIRPGLLSNNDLRDYRSVAREAICQDIESYKVCGAALPASGPIAVMQILDMLVQTSSFYGLAPDSAAFYHRFTEASKLAFADRDKYLADSDFIEAPVKQLLAKPYLQQRARQIPLLKASQEQAIAGTFTGSISFAETQSAEIPSTTHLSIIDKAGNIVSMTTSIEMAFGSQIMVDGFLLNNQLTDFSFTYEDAENNKIANRIEAGKRPRSSMAPMLVFNQQTGLPVLAIGSPGGSRIINYVAKTIAQHLFLHEDLATAIDSPHIINLNKTTEVEKNRGRSLQLNKDLKTLGHQTQLRDQTSGLHAISIKQGLYHGVADSRREGSAIGQ